MQLCVWEARSRPECPAELHRWFVHHILEDEVDGQREEQVDQREKDEEEEVNGDVEAIRETHNNAHETWDGMSECGPKLEPCKCSWFTVEIGRCEVWCLHTHRRLQQTTVDTSEVLWKDGTNNGFLRSIMSLCMHPHLSTFFELLWTPPGIAPLPPTAGGRTRWLVPLLILLVGHGPEFSCSRFLV